MNKFKFFTLLIIAGLFVTFAGIARADYTDYVNGVAVTVKWDSTNVAGGELFFNVTGPDGKTVRVSGTLDENKRGVPDLSGITAGPLANQIIEPPRVEWQTPLDSSPRYDQYFTEEVRPGNSLLGFTSAGQTYYTDEEAVNTLAPQAKISLQEAVMLAYRLAGDEITWGEAGKLASEYGAPSSRGDSLGLDVDLINQIFADAGTSVRVIDNTRGSAFVAATGDDDDDDDNCNPSTIPHGTVSPYPSCTRTCNSGYTLTSGGVCVAGDGNNHCNPSTIPHGTVSPYPSCTRACNSGYVLRNNACVVDETPTCAFTASRLKILYNQPSKLEWSCSNADTCSIAGIGSTPISVSVSGERDVVPLKTTIYTLTCRHGDQSASFDITVQVFTLSLEE